MSKEALLKSVEQLRAEIGVLDPADRDSRRKVKQLIVDLEHQIADENDHEHRASIIERLPELIEHFEAKHPNMTGILNAIMNTLGNMGI